MPMMKLLAPLRWSYCGYQLTHPHGAVLSNEDQEGQKTCERSLYNICDEHECDLDQHTHQIIVESYDAATKKVYNDKTVLQCHYLSYYFITVSRTL